MQAKPLTFDGRRSPSEGARPSQLEDRLIVGRHAVLHVKDGRIYLIPRARATRAAA